MPKSLISMTVKLMAAKFNPLNFDDASYDAALKLANAPKPKPEASTPSAIKASDDGAWKYYLGNRRKSLGWIER